MKTKRSFGLPSVVGMLLSAAFFLGATQGPAMAEQEFASPDDAINALKTAVAARDTNELHQIFGTEAHALVSVDVVEAAAEREAFIQRISERVDPQNVSDTKTILHLGADGWIFPIPLVKDNGGWHFDTAAGREEILNRRIGEDELGAIRVCRTYVEAQREYAEEDRDADGVLEYAQHLRSTSGTRDGLYWPVQAGEELSPLGPLVAAAHEEGYRKATKILTEVQTPYHGYYFKILTRQGRHAPGGKYNYVINGHMVAGFALVAWPAQWGNTGVMTFIVNQNGKVFQKNLGSKTEKIASAMSTYDPDSSWTETQD